MDGPRSASDPRLARALDLLRSALDGAPEEAAGPWQPLPGAIEEDPWLVSATDLLIPWEPEGTAAGDAPPTPPGDPWAGYFAPALPPGAPPAAPAPVDASLLGPPGSLEEPLDDATSFAAAECLYAFVHALGRRDVESALEQVSEDYHAIADDRAVDREGLRHQMERLLDERSGGHLDVSLSAPPEPIPFVDGLILIPATVQVDHRPDGGRATTLLLEWVAALEETPEGFRLCGLGAQRERPSSPLPARGAA